MTHRNRFWYLTLVVVLCAGTACASHQAELKTSLTVLDAARDGFTAWDDQHQHLIVTQATSLEQGQTALEDYRKKREPVIHGFELAYKALATAALSPDASNLVVLAGDLADLEKTVVALGAAWPGSHPNPSPGGAP